MPSLSVHELSIGFDVTPLLSGRTGVARYVRQLVAALEATGVPLRRFAIGRTRHPHHGDLSGVRRVPIPLRVVHSAWSTIGAPKAEWVVRRVDVVHSPDLVPPPTRRPLVMTIHDLDALMRPELHSSRAARIQERQVHAARERAAAILTDSHATAAALREHGVEAERITVAPIGVARLPPSEFSAVPDGPFLLSVGELAPRKGIEVLVEAFAQADLDGIKLVLAGPDGAGTDRVSAAIDRFRVADRVVRAGWVSDAQLAGLYERCLGVCVPSFAEGFGLPVLEAANAGAPVIASDIPVIRELADAVAVWARPRDTPGWSLALERLIADDDLRRESSSRGRSFASRFTWERTAATTVAAYRRALTAG